MTCRWSAKHRPVGIQVATVRNQVALSLFTDFENHTKFKPAAHHEKSLTQVLD
jgi:hypothetical protein